EWGETEQDDRTHRPRLGYGRRDRGNGDPAGPGGRYAVAGRAGAVARGTSSPPRRFTRHSLRYEGTGPAGDAGKRACRRGRPSPDWDCAAALRCPSVPRHAGIHLLRPEVDAAFEVFELLEAGLVTEEFERSLAALAALAVDDDLLVLVQLG